MELYNLASFAGIFILLGLAWLMSNNRKAINCRLVLWGVGIQIVLGAIIFLLISLVPQAYNPFLFLNNLVNTVISASKAGTEFIFGSLADEKKNGFIFIVQAVPSIVFFSGIVAILNHMGFLPFLIKLLARVFHKFLKISGAESLIAGANIFMGVEASLMIKKYIKSMTLSELTTILACGLSTVASNVLALYVFALNESFPQIAAHLISASLLSAPAALVMSKMLFPETGSPETFGDNIVVDYEKHDSIFTAVIEGSKNGMSLIFGIVSLLMVVLGLVKLADLSLIYLTDLIPAIPPLSLSDVLGYAGYPFALIMGVPPADAAEVGKLVALRVVQTEVPAYFQLGDMITNNAFAHARSGVIAAYSLCGFAHVASIAIFTGGYAALEPERAPELARVGLRALVAATFACFLTACIAGTFFLTNSPVFIKL